MFELPQLPQVQKAKSPEMTVVSARITVEQRALLESLGGGAWLRYILQLELDRRKNEG